MPEVEHEHVVALPIGTVYDLIADVTRWPVLFGPTVYVEHIERDLDRGTERFRIWATAKDEVKNWISARTLDPAAHTITFRQEVSQPPVAGMSGYWRLDKVDGETTLVRFGHTYRAIDDDPDSLAWIAEVVDHNSKAELAGLEAAARRGLELEDRSLVFEDTVTVQGDPAAVYESVLRRLERRGVAVAPLPPRRIGWKCTAMPPGIDTDVGCWTFTTAPGGVRVSAHNTVVAADAGLAGDAMALAPLRERIRREIEQVPDLVAGKIPEVPRV